MEEENLNTEVEQENKNNFNRVTPLSKYLALALFIILPFLGGWIGYNYASQEVVEVEKVVVKEIETQLDAEEMTFSDEWITLPMCTQSHADLHGPITFPASMGMKVSENQEGECYDLGYEFGPYIKESIKEDVSIFLLDDNEDLKYLSFVVYKEGVNQDILSIYVSDSQEEKVYLMDTHAANNVDYKPHNTGPIQYSRGLLIEGDDSNYVAYKWWDDEVGTYVDKIFSFDADSVVYDDACINLGGHLGAGGIFGSIIKKDSYKDGLLIYTDCEDRVMFTDFETSQRVSIPDQIIRPQVVGFVSEDRIVIVDMDTEELLRHPVYSINLDGTDLIKEERTEYGGF